MRRVRDNFHVVLSFSPIGKEYRRRYKQFPSLFTIPVMNWVHGWPREALVSVATTFLAGCDTGSDANAELLPLHMVHHIFA